MSNGNKKSLGPDHYFSQYGGERPIPEAFVAAMERTEERRSVPKDYELPASTPEIVEARFEPGDRRTNEKLLIVVRKKTGNITLQDIRTNDQGQPVQVTQTLFPTGTTPTEPTATTNVAVQDLGNGWSIQEVGVEGTYVAGEFVPGVFAANVFERERPNLTPEEFRPTIPTVTTRVDSAGTAVDPTLSGTELSERQEQLNEFKKRITVSTQATPSLPVTRDKGRDTNQEKQDVIVTRKLIADGTAADVATALKDVSVKQLGDGNKVQETREVTEVFPRTTERLAIPNIIPERFKGSVPVFTRSEDDAGTQTAITSLNDGEFERTVERLTEFTRKITNTYLDLEVLPITQTDTAVDKEGVTTSVVFTIAYGAQTISAATNLSSAEMSDLGVGLTLKTEIFDTLPGPTLTKTDFDKDGILKTTTRRKMLAASVITSEDLTTGVFTRKSKEPVNSTIAYQIIETITVDDADLLDLPSFTTSIPNVIPELFRALIPTHVESHIEEGTAAETALDTGEFEHSERQLTPLYMEVRSTILDDLDSLPITITGLKETNDKKQVVSVTMTLEADSTTPTAPNEVRDVDFKKLGNGLAVEIVRTVPSVFPEDSYTKSVLNLIPEKFRGLIPLSESTVDSAGTPSTNPTLLSGELSRTEGRITAFTKRVRITALGTISFPVSITDTETNDQKQTVAVLHKLQVAGTSTAVPTALIDVEVINLGNGYEIETQRTIVSIFDPATYTVSIPNLIPEQFRAQVALRTEIHFVASTEGEPDAGTASAPDLDTGEFERSERQINEFVKEVRVQVLEDIDSLPITIIGQKETNEKKQVVTVSMTLELASTTPTVPTALTDVDFKKLGNGLAVEITKTIASVFSEVEYSKELPDVTPLKFKNLIPITGTGTTAAGNAAAPTLVAGDVSAADKQIDAFTHRTTVRNRAAASLPVSIVSKKTNDKKQVVTVTETLELATTTPTAPTALLDVTFEKLGDGTAVETQEAIASVFDKDTRSIEIPDVTPPWARSLLATTNISSEAAATSVSDPTLSTGQLRKQVRRTTEKTVQTDITARDAASLPKTRTNKRLTTEFGGGAVDQVETIATGLQSISSGGLLVLDSEMEVLGDGTSALKTSTQSDGSWPVLSDYDIDEETGQTILTTYQVVAAGTAATATISGGVVTRYKHIDKWRSLKIIATYSTPASYDEQRFGAHSFPTLWDGAYSWTPECGAFATGFRGGFSAMVRMRVTVSFSSGRHADIDGLTLIPQTFILGKGVQLPSDLIVDAGSFIYSGTCVGTESYLASSPDYSTYIGTYQGTEQLITGESVKMQKSGLYRTTLVYVYML